MTSSEINRKIADISGETVILMFSRGKESICCFYELKKYFKKIILVHQYLHPNLSFVNDSLKYFEEKFEQKIFNIPHVSLFRMINEHVFQSPETSDIIQAMGLPKHSYLEYYDCLREDFNCENAFVATGIRSDDSPLRRMSLKTSGYISKIKRGFYPIFDWSIADIKNCLRENNIKPPVDYEMFGRSFDGINYKYLKPIKEHFPLDYEKLKQLFPLIDLEILRYEQI